MMVLAVPLVAKSGWPRPFVLILGLQGQAEDQKFLPKGPNATKVCTSFLRATAVPAGTAESAY